MSQFNSHGSAFYSGATRYGGSAAHAKRREAARKALFTTVKEIPSASTSSTSRSNMFNGPNLINTYTINSNNIVRRETNEPQLTSQAKKIYSWIEENSYAQQETFRIGKQRRTVNKQRFNPLVALPIAPTPLPPPPVPPPSIQLSLTNQVIPELPKIKALDHHDTTTKLPPPVEPPSSSKFRKPTHCGTSKEIKHVSSQPKKFSPPKDLKPRPVKVIESPKDVKPTPIKRMMEPVKEVKPQPMQMSESPKVTSLSSRFVENNCTSQQETFRAAKQQKMVEVQKFNPPAATLPIVSPTTIAATKPTQQQPPPPPSIQLNLTNQVIPELPKIKTLDNDIKLPPPVEPPFSSKFMKPKHCGPRKEIKHVSSQPKKFSPPKDLNPKQIEVTEPPKDMKPEPMKKIMEPVKEVRFQETKIPESPEVKSLSSGFVGNNCETQQETFGAAKQQETVKVQRFNLPAATLPMAPPTTTATTTPTPPTTTATTTPAPPTTTAATTPTPPQPTTTTTTSNKRPLDVEMDMDVDMFATAQAPPAPPATPSTPFLPPSSVPSNPMMTLPSTTIQLGTQPQPLFMAPPSFSTPPTFIAPVPPPVTATNNTMMNGSNSNPFQPVSSVRGRKILRPTRRLHR